MENDDVILTDNGEFMTFEESKIWNATVFRKATKKESNDFYNERIALEKQFRQQEMEDYFHELKE
jgi:hypothetical protein